LSNLFLGGGQLSCRLRALRLCLRNFSLGFFQSSDGEIVERFLGLEILGSDQLGIEELLSALQIDFLLF
jgi:hypothetical protein